MGSSGACVVTVIFPLADLRSFYYGGAGALDGAFTRKDLSSHLRRFGSGMYRNQETARFDTLPLVLRATETWFISARRFLRVPGAPIPPRVFGDGFLSARLDITLTPDTPPDTIPVSDWAKSLLDQPVELKSVRSAKPYSQRRQIPLREVGRHFEDAYVAATTCEPLRKQARIDPEGKTADDLREARRLVIGLEPLLLMVAPPDRSKDADLPMRTGAIRPGGRPFRLMTLHPTPTTDPALIQLARRSFTRLMSEGRAIQALSDRWMKAPPPNALKPALITALDRMADRLFDSGTALTDGQGEAVTMLGELAPIFQDAAERLGGFLDEMQPEAGRGQRRLAASLARQVRRGATVNVNIGGIVGVQGSMSGGCFTQNATRAA